MFVSAAAGSQTAAPAKPVRTREWPPHLRSDAVESGPMLLRLILIGAAVCLIAAFLGKRKLALWLLAGLGLLALLLWGYESYQLRSQGQLFMPGEVVIEQVKIVPSNYRPNLFELRGHVHNQSEQTTLDGVLLHLKLMDCTAVNQCEALPARDEYVATKLAPQNQASFLEKIYFEEGELPQGELRVEYEVKSLRGHRPVW